METKTNNRGEKLVKVRNVDTGYVCWKRKDSYLKSMKQWELTTDETTDEKNERSIVKVIDDVEVIKKVTKSKSKK